MNLRQTLAGTGVAIITPFKSDFTIDYESLGGIIDFIITKQVNYIVTLGTTGETPVLTHEEKKEIIEFSAARINNKVPLVIGVGGNDSKAVVKDMESLPLENATAILSASPYYNKPSQEGLFQHYRLIASASPKPVILYNVPGRTGRNISASTTIRIANEIENIMGIKEAGGDMNQCMELLHRRPEHFLIVSGDDALALPQIACGMDGVISVAANAFPKEFSDMVRLCLDQNFKEAKKINDRLLAVYDLMFVENNPAGVKAFLHEMQLIQNVLRLPLVPLSGELNLKVKDYLSQWS